MGAHHVCQWSQCNAPWPATSTTFMSIKPTFAASVMLTASMTPSGTPSTTVTVKERVIVLSPTAVRLKASQGVAVTWTVAALGALATCVGTNTRPHTQDLVREREEGF